MPRLYRVIPPRWVLAAFSSLVIIFSGRGQTTTEAQTTLAFVQVNSATPQTALTTVTVLYRAAQSAGNLNVVVVGWNDTTAQVQSVVDTQGNSYVRAVGPTVRSSLGTQSIYYAANIAAAPANGNVVTVTFTAAAQFADIRIAEYRGVAQTSPVDVAVGGQGSGTTSSSGAVTTTNPNDLIVGANLVAERTTAAGTGFTNRIITSQDGDIFEDRIVTTAGANSATARLSGGAWVMQMVAFRAGGAASDTQPPTPPTNLLATATSASQVSLTWIASTDNVGVTNYLIERCTGSGCTGFAQIAATGSTAYGDVTVSPGMLYRYRVRATDAAGNLGPYSTVASATTPVPDSQPPTAPTGLIAVAGSGSQVNLTWSASSDGVGVTGYLIERCQGASCVTFVQIGSSPSTTYSDTTATASTPYSYRVRATDAAANLSGYSNTASVTTTAVTVSFVQMNYATPQANQVSVAVAYTADESAGNLNVVVVGWNDTTAQVQSVTDSKGNAYARAVGPTTRAGLGTQSIYYATSIAGAAAGANVVTVTFSSAAKNADVRIAEYQGISSASPVDATAAASGSGTTSSSGSVTTTNAADLLVGANLVATTTMSAGSSFTKRVITVPDGDILEDRTVSTVGSYSATASNTNGAWVMQLVAFRAGASAPDVQPPTAPTNLVATSTSGSTSLTWTASTDNIAVANYLVERCQGPGCSTFGQIGTSNAATYSDSTTAPATSYSYRVRAADPAGNLSGYSNTATTATAAPDTDPPSAPGTLTATAISGTQINLSWVAAVDNVGVTGYRVERCQGVGCSIFAKLATPTGTTFVDTGLTPSTTYTYIVLASDAAGNLGPASSPASATTDTRVPELVAAYSFNEGTGTTAIDVSGKGNHGAIGTATWTTSGKFGGALSFNGSSRVVVPDNVSLRLTTGLTLEAWVNPSITSAGWRDVVYKGNDNYFLEATTPSAGRPSAGVSLVGSGNSNTFGPSVVPTNTWSHLAETYDGSAVRLYVNGVQVATTSITGTLVTSTNPLEIGGDGIFGQYFQGLIDEVRVYNVARTPTQIQSDMASPVGGNVPVVTLSRSSIDFGQQAIGINSGSGDVTLTNIGGGPLTILGISMAGAGAADFSQTNDCGTSVPPVSSCSLHVTFTPSTSGGRSSTLAIQDDATGSPQTIALQGVGVPVLVSPGTTTLTPGRTQQFSAQSSTTGTFLWSVDGVIGGAAGTGTISAAGLYTAPSGVGSHVVTATTSDQSQSGNATVFVVSSIGVLTYHNDNARTGSNLNEAVLTPANVKSASFGKLHSYDLDGVAMASPLYVPAVPISGEGVHNVVYVATEHDSVYALDADGLVTAPLWRVSFINPAAGVTTVNPADTGECCDIAPEIGITGTPVIDPVTATLYVVAKTKEIVGGNTSYVQRLHALDLGSGAEKFGGPVTIQATVTGSGAGSTGGHLAFLALRENQRPALLLNSGVVYIAFGSHGDQQPYHGWVMGYNATSLQQAFAYCVTPNGEGAGVWLANAGLTADAAGNVYLTTGDGSFDANQGGTDLGDSYIKLSPTGAVLDYFTPHNEAMLDQGNIDLGAGGILILPDQSGTHPHLLVSAGKNGTIDLIDRDNMGHYNPNNDSQIVQSLINIFPFGTPEPGNYSAPVYFNGTIFFSPVADSIQAFALTNARLSTSPTSRSSEVFAYPGGTLAVSANGSSNGILWALERRGSSSGALRAYDATNLGIELYHSDQAGSRDALDEVVKFSAPVVANGKVYVGSATKLTIYGLFQ